MHGLARFAPVAAILLVAIAAHADGTPAPSDVPAQSQVLPKSNKRRSGLEVGLMIGGGVAGSSGYPNNDTLINNPNYYSASGLMTGTAFTLSIMGALTDYLNFGFWFGSATYQNADWRSVGGGGGFRVEVFPLYALVPALKDLGVAGQFGIGTTTLNGKFKSDVSNVSSDGTESFLGVGTFYEWRFAKLFGGHAVFGPSLDYDVVAARSIERHGATLSGRLVFYGGP
jgi:hypothetical protein